MITALRFSLLALVLLPGVASTQESSPPPAAAGQQDTALAMNRPETKAARELQVSSPVVRDGAALPQRHSAYGEGVSPGIRWSGAPEGTRSFVLLMEDPDARRQKPFVHWVAYDIPPSSDSLPLALPTNPRLEGPLAGMLQGKNGRGAVGYFGPRPPEGDPPHHYHFQVFALDRTLGLEAGAGREDVLKAMAGHVLARGELVATYGRKSQP